MSNAEGWGVRVPHTLFGILEIPAFQKYGTRGQTGKTGQGVVVLFPPVSDMSYMI